MRRRLRVLVHKELIQALRDPRMRTVLIGPPILQLLMFGFAVNLDVENVRLAWLDNDRTPQSRELHDAFDSSRYFDVVATPVNEAEAQRLVDNGKAQAAVAVLPGFARDLERGRQAQVQVIVDGSNSNTASLISNYSGQIIAAFAAERLADQQKQRLLAGGAAAAVNLNIPQVNARSRVWFNEELKSRNYFVPGVIVNIIMLVTMMLTALAIVREKEIGTMEQLMVTPIRPIEVILGKTVPFAIVGIVETILITGLALLIFHIPFRGSPLLLLACSVLYLMSTLGAGLFLSTISQTQQQAMLGAFIFFMPAFTLSGFAFPIRNMPLLIQWATYLNPLRYFMEIVRGIFLKGTGVDVLWPQILALGIYGLAILSFSALRFHKRLD